MGMAVVRSRTIDGLRAIPVQVEVHLANGLPSLTLVGLADTEVREARERVRAALQHSGLGFPHNQRVTVNLAPADVPKESGRFDLPIALGILAAQGLLDPTRLDAHEYAGELSLAGELRPIRGALALALGLRAEQPPNATTPNAPGRRGLVLPAGSADEAAWVPGIDVRRAQHLLEVVAFLDRDGPAAPLPQAQARRAPAVALMAGRPGVCLRDVRGQHEAKRALELAAAGHHSLLLVGPPGSGKSMLAERLPGLLPPLTDEQALDCAALASVTRRGFQQDDWQRRPWRAPHHSCSAAALIGGGNPPGPGELSLADHGVLFLDELPEFSRRALESLREPLETGHVNLSRAGRQARFPSRVLLAAALNPCPCGWLGSRTPGAPACRCTPEAVLRYQARVSGPLLDRIDLRLTVSSAAPSDLLQPPQGDSSSMVAARVDRARARQVDRQGCLNAQLDSAGLQVHAPLQEAARTLLQQAAERLGLSGRSLHRVLRVARTAADLAERDTLAVQDVAEALQLRRGLPGLSPAPAPTRVGPRPAANPGGPPSPAVDPPQSCPH